MAEIIEDYLGMNFSASELRGLVDWPESVIDDYTSITGTLRQLRPIFGRGAPEGSVPANLSGMYFDLDETPVELWCNENPSTRTGWRKVSV